MEREPATGTAAVLRAAASAIAAGRHVVYAVNEACGVYRGGQDSFAQAAAERAANHALGHALDALLRGRDRGDLPADSGEAVARLAARLPDPAAALRETAKTAVDHPTAAALARAADTLESGYFLRITLAEAAGVHEAPRGAAYREALVRMLDAQRDLRELLRLPRAHTGETDQAVTEAFAAGNPDTAIALAVASARAAGRHSEGPTVEEEIAAFAFAWPGNADALRSALRDLLHMTIAAAAGERPPPSPDEFAAALSAAREACENAAADAAGLADTLFGFDPWEA